MVMQRKQSVNTGKECRLFTRPVVLCRPGMGWNPVSPQFMRGFVLEMSCLSLLAVCQVFVHLLPLFPPHFTALLYCMWLFFSGSLWHLAAHLVHALFQSTRQQLPTHPAPSISCKGPTQSSLVAKIIIPLLEGWPNSKAWLQGSLFTVYSSYR